MMDSIPQSLVIIEQGYEPERLGYEAKEQGYQAEPDNFMDSNIEYDNRCLYILDENYDLEFVPNQRDGILRFISDAADIDPADKATLVKDVRELPEADVAKLHSGIKNNIKIASILVWERRLMDFMNGTPPPPKYAIDKGSRSAPEFLEQVWGKYLDHGVLYQSVLSDYDDKIIPALHRYWQTHGRSTTDRLPPTIRERTDVTLQRAADCGPYTVEEIKRAVNAAVRREARGRGG